MSDEYYGTETAMSDARLVLQLRALAFDLENLALRQPEPTTVLEQWAVAQRAVPCLIGRSSGHPFIGEGKPCFTSEVFYLNLEAGLARSFTRWYRLGQPAGSGNFDGRRGNVQ